MWLHVQYSGPQHLTNTTAKDEHNQLLLDRVMQPGLIHTAQVTTLRPFCDPFPVAQFVSCEKGFKLCEKLPLCLIYSCCLNRKKNGSQKNMNETQWEPTPLPRSPCDVWIRRAKPARRMGERFVMEVEKHLIASSKPLNGRPWGTEPSCRCQCDTSGSNIFVLRKGLG